MPDAVRILVVSAHYPPNFISGGTLGPQRIARGLKARGHEVSVYAGWLGDREPLETWCDVDEVGIPVQWIVVTPWTYWWLTRNFDNADVASSFKVHLAEVKPDIVHVHSLQTLGRGIVDACAEAGVKVVVTMHDFWWICARQFQSNRALQLCSEVLSCGMCHCEVDRDWLEQRNTLLRETLAGVDVVLAVSESEAAILRANGIGVDPTGPTLVVDENGLPPLPSPGRLRLTDDDVVFLYTGGSEVMKGARVVLDAATLLAQTSGWTVHAYGLEEYLEAFDRTCPANVVVRPRFTPAEADDIFDQADVLLLTSVVRESHSLVTREALSRGMPVITSDTVGPEEVVVERENGLIVPTGDPRALAAAMRAVIDDKALRRHLADGARRPVPIRPLDDQLTGLEARFRALTSVSPKIAPGPSTVRNVLFVVGIDGAPLRYRAQFAAEALDLHHVSSWVCHYRSPSAAAFAMIADAVVLYRVPATDQVLRLIDSLHARGTQVFFDVDDLIFDPSIAEAIPAVQRLSDDERDLYMQGVGRYRTTLEACDAFIGSTEMLVTHVRNVVGIEAHRWSNGVGIGPARCADAALGRARTAGRLRIGYMSGTNTHDGDWAYVEPAIVALLQRRPEVELWLGGLVTPSRAIDALGQRVKRIPLKPWWELPWVLRDLDVNLAPLAPDLGFNEAKSAIKWLEAALTATPTVATSTQPFREVIDDGRNGRLATSPDEFAVAVGDLLDDDLRRTRMGRLARRDALLGWSPHLQGRRYLDILESGAARQRPFSTWTGHTALDEPWADIPVEEYIVPDPMVLAPLDPVSVDDLSPANGQARSVRTRTSELAETFRRVASIGRRMLK